MSFLSGLTNVLGNVSGASSSISNIIGALKKAPAPAVSSSGSTSSQGSGGQSYQNVQMGSSPDSGNSNMLMLAGAALLVMFLMFKK
jgi:hypothetical protein